MRTHVPQSIRQAIEAEAEAEQQRAFSNSIKTIERINATVAIGFQVYKRSYHVKDKRNSRARLIDAINDQAEANAELLKQLDGLDGAPLMIEGPGPKPVPSGHEANCKKHDWVAVPQEGALAHTAYLKCIVCGHRATKDTRTGELIDG
jgi:hypothetical protein